MESRLNKYDARGEYDGKSFVVKTGSKISPTFASHVDGGKAALLLRNDSMYVNSDGYVIKDCSFNSPSTAAQFVCGYSINGYRAWHNDEGEKLSALRKIIG